MSFLNLNKKKSCLLLVALLPFMQAKSNNNNNNNVRFLSAQGDSDGKGCWIESYGRGVGKPITTCPDGLDYDAALCYPRCQDGYKGVGPVCWQNCPSDFTDTGADCLKPGSYGRGAGYAIWDKTKCENDNPQGCELNGALYYPKCKDGYHNVGCCVCSPNCIDGMTDIGVSCQKQSYGRGVGKPLVCAAGEEEDAALCYTPCKKDYKGVGPVCWGGCPAGMYQCGALCLESKDACISDMLKIADKVLDAMSKAYDEDEDIDKMMTVAETGVDIGAELARMPMCSNM